MRFRLQFARSNGFHFKKNVEKLRSGIRFTNNFTNNLEEKLTINRAQTFDNDKASFVTYSVVHCLISVSQPAIFIVKRFVTLLVSGRRKKTGNITLAQTLR